MAFVGREFIDVLSVIGVSQSDTPPVVEMTTTRIARLTDEIRIRTAGGSPEVIVYFAPATYVINRHPSRVDRAWEGDLTLPRESTAWFEAGAVLELRGPARVVLNGALVAPEQQIFREGTHGMVVLGGSLEDVHPEWWGARNQPGQDDTDALQRAIDASSARRQQLNPDIGNVPQWELRRPLPVLLSGQYAVSRGLVVGRALGIPPNPAATPPFPMPRIPFGQEYGIATTLRGTIARIDGPTTGLYVPSGNPSAFAGSSMLTTTSSTGTIIEDVSFDGGGKAETCLAIETPDNPSTVPPSATSAQSTSIRGCAFRKATSVLLRLGARPQVTGSATILNPDSGRVLFDGIPNGATPPARADQLTAVEVPGTANPRSQGDLVGLLIQGCRFSVSGTPGSNTRAIEVAASNLCPGRIVDCRFTGDASAFIDAVGGWFLLEGCHFDNARMPAQREAVEAMTTVVAGQVAMSVQGLGFEPPNASDIYLREEVFPIAGSTRVPPGHVPAALAMTGCTSRSAMLFDTIRPSTVFGQRPRRSVMLLGNLHTPPGPRREGVDASVRWGRARINGVLGKANLSDVAMNADTSLSVLGCALPLGFAVYQGAAQSAVVASTLDPRGQPRFRVTRAGFETRTLVFGLAMMLLALFGCEGPGAAASHDAQSIYNDLTTDHGEAVIDARIPLAVDAAVDASSAPQDLQVIHDDLGYQVITDFGPPRQTRRNCPAAPMGEAGIEAPRLRAPGTARRVTSHRPTLEWILPPGVTGARVEICRDPCCTNPVTSFDAEGSQGRPAQALPPGVMFWRVRGKVGERVGRETSFTWEFGVRRRDTPTDTTAGVIHDFNGDGFDDVGVSYVQQTNSTRNSALRVFYGSPLLLSVDNTQTIPAVGQGLSTAVGDFNGDGFADVLSASVNVGDPRFYAVGIVAYGGRDGLHLDGTAIMFYTAVLAVGDFNGDGLSDVASADSELVNDNGHGPRRVKVIYGSSDGLGQGGAHYIDSPAAPYRYARFDPLASPGDLDGDGFEELLVGSSNLEISINSIGRVYVLAGASSGVRATAARTIDRPVGVRFSATGFGEQGWAIGDINGDRVGEFAILEDFVAQVNLYTGGGSEHLRYLTYLHTPTEELTRFPGLYFGSSVSSGDVDADGVPEVVVGCVPCTEQIAGVRHIGQVYIYEINGQVASISRTIVAPRHEPDREPDRFGATVLSGLDLDGDGFDETLLTVDSSALYEPGTLYLFHGSAAGPDSVPVQIIGDQLPLRERRWLGAVLADLFNDCGEQNALRG